MAMIEDRQVFTTADISAGFLYDNRQMFQLRQDEAEGYASFLREADWDIAWSALVDGTHVDALFGKSAAKAAAAKRFLREVESDEEKKKCISAYAALFNSLSEYHRQLNASW